MNSLPQNPDARDTLPESDATEWSAFWDCFRYELGPASAAGDDFPPMEPAEPLPSRYSVESLANISNILAAFDRGV
jgi:hypothetical protein